MLDQQAAKSAAWLVSVVAFAVAMAATPGPNNAMLAASGASFGFRRTLPHMLGVSIGFPVMLVAVALGASQPLRSWLWLREALRWIGAAYLLWLAWHIATARPAARTGGEASGGGASRPLAFWQAALFQWINPKAWVIAATAVITYTKGGALLAQAAILGVIFLIVTLSTTAFWTSVGAGAARVLRSQSALRIFNLVVAALLVASLLPLLGES